jgi:hypothetical protein
MRKSLLVLAVLACCFTLPAVAADHPSFAGSWALNPSKSDLGPLPVPEKYERRVEESGQMIRMSSVQALNGAARSSVVEFPTDGREVEVKIGGADARISATWKDNLLTVVTKRGPATMEVVTTDVWSLEGGGKVWTVASTIGMPQGDVHLKLVFDKQ